MSGTEAISTGVPIFKPPESRNAATTLTIMAALLGIFFVGVSYLSTHMGLVPGDESIVSGGVGSLEETLLLCFPVRHDGHPGRRREHRCRFSAPFRTCQDNFMPTVSSTAATVSPSPPAYSSVGSAFLLFVFRGNVDSLIHLYAVGVFLAFSLSNTGMVVHCGELGRGMEDQSAINGIGRFTSGSSSWWQSQNSPGAWIIV
jgi:hypothetical protein